METCAPPKIHTPKRISGYAPGYDVELEHVK